MPAGPRRRIATRLIGLAALGLFASGCKDNKLTRIGFPEPITKQGEAMLGVWRGFFITAICVGVFVIAMILYTALFFHRREGDELPRQVRYNLPIEVLYTLVPVLIVGVLFYFTAIRENDVDKFDTLPAQVHINVVGFQWNWQFNYLDDGVAVTGRPGQEPTLTLPVGETVRFYETSPDVIHAFWVIPFLFKRDVVPGHQNSFQETLTHTGWFDGKCTEYCGLNHDRMLFRVHVVSLTDYRTWLQQTKATAAGGNNDMISVYNGPGVATFERNGVTGNTQRSHQ